MAKKVSKLIIAKKQEGEDRITIETVDMPPLEEVKREACERYMNGDMEEFEFREWMLILTEMEESLHSSNQVKSDFDVHLRPHFTDKKTKNWIKTITEISDLNKQKEM